MGESQQLGDYKILCEQRLVIINGLRQQIEDARRETLEEVQNEWDKPWILSYGLTFIQRLRLMIDRVK